DTRRDPAIPGILRGPSAGAAGTASRKGYGSWQIASARVAKSRIEIGEMVMGLVRGRVDLIMKARRNRQFGCNPPGIAHKQHEPVGASVDLGGGVKRCLRVIHLLQQEAGDGAASL